MNLTNKTAIVTGGTKGIGRGIAEALIRGSGSVCISARHPNAVNDAVEQRNGINKGRAVGFVCDVRDYRSVKGLIAHTVKELGGLDILVNNAGIGTFRTTVEETSPDDFRAVLETNVFGVFYCCREAIPL